MSRAGTPPAALQLDIFEHSRDVMLRNQVAQAIEACDAGAARAACDALANEYPQDDSLGASRRLAASLAQGDGRAFQHHDVLREARRTLEQDLRPAARRVLGDRGAATWLTLQWRRLAQCAQGLGFDAEHADDHAAALWLEAGDWEAAERAVTGIASWRRIPAPLAWMVEARLHLVGLQPTWPMVAELSWLSPRRLQDLARRSPDPILIRLLGGFEREFDGEGEVGDLAWFPAWVLTRRPDLRECLSAAQPSQHEAPERAMRVMVELLGLERQGRQHDVVERRKTLRDLHPSLYATYLSTR